MFEKLGVQAYTFRKYYDGQDSSQATLEKAFRTIKDYGYDEIQTAGFGAVGIEKYAQLAHDAGLEIIGTHYDYNELTNDIDEAMRKHSEILGTNIIGIGSMPFEARSSKEELFKFIDTFNRISETVYSNGFKLTYHNHHFEFVKFDDGKTIMDYLYEELNPVTISFCLDTHWVQRGGANPTTWVEKLAGRIDILHLKDMGVINSDSGVVPFITEVGNGQMDFDSICAAAEKGGVRYYCVEQDTCPGDPLDSLKISADYIRKKYMA
ncbi:MAG: sugar phosphate isomerase/epimerase [Ruminococcaceae bacterium]|nr:sugar phosphate isomerase/epimerase [Oscillospiraceae bacterium]